MTSFVIVCIVCVFSLASVNGKGDAFVAKNVSEMSDREMMNFLVTRITLLETDNRRQEERISSLEDTVLRQNDVIKHLQKILQEDDADDDVTVEKVDTDISEHEASANETTKQKSKREIIDYSTNISPKSNMVRTRRQISATPVAFSSFLTNNMDHLGAHQDIVFDSTYVNTNNVYNPHHGVFVAPVPGIYVITTTVLANQNREVYAEIVVNGALKAYAYARGTDNRHDQGTQTILLHLKQGDDVGIRNYSPDDSVYGHLYTTFSGFLLFEDESRAIVG